MIVYQMSALHHMAVAFTVLEQELWSKIYCIVKPWPEGFKQLD